MIEIEKALSDHGHPSTLRLVPAAAAVLVLDDDPDMRESLAMMLEGHGFRVLTANDGVRGLRVFREQATNSRALLTPFAAGSRGCACELEQRAR